MIINKCYAISLTIVGLALFAFSGCSSKDNIENNRIEDNIEKVALSANNNFEIEDETSIVKNEHGYNISIRTIRPQFSKYPQKQFPVVLRIAGGWGNSTFLLNNELVRNAASHGLIIVAFDSEPKAEYSVGFSQRDYNGYKDQDDAATVLAYIFNLSNVNSNMVGIWSHSNGITLASGLLGRTKYYELSKKVKFLLDDEGPYCPQAMLDNSDIQFHTQGIEETWAKVVDAKVGVGKEYQTEDDFFSERCAVYFIGNYEGIYQRVQAKDDHETSNWYGHAAAMINAATPPNGKAQWTRLNFQPKNKIHTTIQSSSDSINIENVLDVDKFMSANDNRIWDVLADLFNQ